MDTKIANLIIKIKQFPEHKDLPLPKYMSKDAAGMDLYAAVTEPMLFAPQQVRLVPTGIAISMPRGYEAQIRPRSGLAIKHGITLLNTPGTIDADYRGEIKIIMINLGLRSFILKRGDRIAQMVFNKIERVNFNLVEELDDTKRGAGGFGHTGL